MAQNDIKVSVGLDKNSIAQVTRELKMAVIQGTDVQPSDFAKVINSLKAAIKQVEAGGSSMAKPLAEAMKRSVSYMEAAFSKGTNGSRVLQRELQSMIRTLNMVSSASGRSAAAIDRSLDRATIRAAQSVNRSQRQMTSVADSESRKREAIYRREQRAVEREYGKSLMARVQHAAKTVAAYAAIGTPIMMARRAVMDGMRRQREMKEAFAMGQGSGVGLFADYEHFALITTRIANSSGLAASEVDRLALAMAQAGISGAGSEKVLKSMSESMRLSFGQMDPKLAIQGFNAIKNTFFSGEQAASQYAKTIESLNRAVALSNVAASDPRQIIEAVTKVGAGAGLAGFDPDTLMALLIGATEESGVATTQFATALRRTMPRLYAKKTMETLQGEFGIDYMGDDGRMRSQSDILLQMSKRYQELREQGDLFGAQQMTLAAAGTVRYNDLIKILESYIGLEDRKRKGQEESLRVQEKLDTANASLSVSFQSLQNSSSRVWAGFIEESGTVSEIIHSLSNALDSMSQKESAMLGDFAATFGAISAMAATGVTAKGLGMAGLGAGLGIAAKLGAITLTAAVAYLNWDTIANAPGTIVDEWNKGIPIPETQAGMPGRGTFDDSSARQIAERLRQQESGILDRVRGGTINPLIISHIEQMGSPATSHESRIKTYREATGFDMPEKFEFEKFLTDMLRKDNVRNPLRIVQDFLKSQTDDSLKVFELIVERGRQDSQKDLSSIQESSQIFSGSKDIDEASRKYKSIFEDLSIIRDEIRAGVVSHDLEFFEGYKNSLTEEYNRIKSQKESSTADQKREMSKISSMILGSMQIVNQSISMLTREASRVDRSAESSKREEEAEARRRQRQIDAAIKKSNRAFEDFMNAKIGSIESEALSISELMVRKDPELSQDWLHISEEIDITTEGIRNSLQDLTVGLLGSAMDEVDKLGVVALSEGVSRLRSAIHSSFSADTTESRFSAMKMQRAYGDLMASMIQAGGFGTSGLAASLGSTLHPVLGSQIGMRKSEADQNRMIKEGIAYEREAIEWARKSAEHLDSIDSKTGHVESSIKGLLSGAMMGKVDVKGFWSSLLSPIVEGRSGTGASAIAGIGLGGGLRLGDYLTAIIQPGGIQQVESEHAALRAATADPSYGMGMQVMQAMSGAGGQQYAIKMASAAMGNKALKSGVFGASATRVLSGLGDLVTGFSYITAAREILKSAGIGTTKVTTDDRRIAEDTNTAVSGLYENLKDNALNFVQDDMMRIFGYTPSYDTITKSSDRRGGLQGLFGGKRVHYVSDFAGARSIEEMKRMEYDAIISSAQYETDMRFRELDIMKDRLEKIRLMVSIASDSNIELDKLAQAEAEAIATRAKMMDYITDSVASALQMSTNMASAFTIMRKHSIGGARGLLGIVGDENQISTAARKMRSDMARSVFLEIRDDLTNLLHRHATGTDLQFFPLTLVTRPTEGMFEFRTTDINQMVSQLPDLLEWAMKPGAGDWQMKLVDLAVDMINLQRAVVGELISISESNLGSISYLAGMEGHQKNISEIEEKAGSAFSKFAEDILRGDVTSVGGEDWTYRIREMRERYAAIESFTGGGIASNLSALWNPSILEGVLEKSNKSPEEIEYAKSLIASLTSSLIGAFGTLADADQSRARAADEESAMYQVGSTGKYYITQNFVVESTYFGGSQTDAVQFLKFLSKAWNSVGDKNMTGKLF